jgi:hypothetical protein
MSKPFYSLPKTLQVGVRTMLTIDDNGFLHYIHFHTSSDKTSTDLIGGNGIHYERIDLAVTSWGGRRSDAM